MGGAAAPQTSRTGVTATIDMVNKYGLLIKILMEPPALYILQQNVLARKYYLEIIKMALNNVRQDSWGKCKIKWYAKHNPNMEQIDQQTPGPA